MTIQTLSNNGAIQYNSKYFDENAVERMCGLNVEAVSLKTKGRSSRMHGAAPAKFRTDSAYDTNITKDAVAEAIAWMKTDPEYASAIAQEDESALQRDIFDSLECALGKNKIDEALVEANRRTMQHIRCFTDEQGMFYLNAGDEVLFQVNTKQQKGAKLKKILAAAKVLLDVVAIISDIIGIGLHYGNKTAQKVADWLKKIESTILGWGQAMWKSLKGITPKLKQARNSSNWVKTIKKFASRIGQAIFDGLAWAWENRGVLGKIKDAFMYGFKAMFAGTIASCIYYTGKLIGTLITLAYSAGANIYVMILELVLDLCSLGEDLIEFAAQMKLKTAQSPDAMVA